MHGLIMCFPAPHICVNHQGISNYGLDKLMADIPAVVRALGHTSCTLVAHDCECCPEALLLAHDCEKCTPGVCSP